MSNDLFLQKAEHRLSKWLEIQEKIKHKPDRSHPTVTISRKYGCQAFALANSLKEILDEKTGEEWTIFDDSLIQLISKEEGISERILKRTTNQEHTTSILGGFFPSQNEDEDLFHLIAKYIIDIAQHGNAIIIGRGSEYLTKDIDNCFNFRLDADEEFRAHHMSQCGEIPFEDALDDVRRHSEKREKFVEQHFGKTAGLIEDYDAIFNNATHPVDRIARAIASFTVK